MGLKRRCNRWAAGAGLALLAGWLSVSAAETQFFEPSRSNVSDRDYRGFLAVKGKRVLASENPTRLFIPASVLKLIVAATALHHLGPQHQRVTTLLGLGQVAGGTLPGDLVLAAAADPTWNRRFHPQDPRAPLNELARQVLQAGVRRVNGDLVLDVSAYPGPAHPPNRVFAERSTWYGAPFSAVAIDENVSAIKVGPGPQVGAPGSVPAAMGAIPLINRVVTSSKERHGKGGLEFYPAPDGSSIVVQGEYPISEPPYEVQVAIPAPERHAGEALLKALRLAGVVVQGQVRVNRKPLDLTGAVVLARLQSPPLSAILEPILKNSHNLYAETLLVILGREIKGEGRIDLGLDVERDYLTRQVGLDPDSFFLDDGSGLSPQNLVAPDALVALLAHSWRQPWRDVFVANLASPGQGTLRGYAELPPISAKTGTIKYTLGLAGYLHPERPDPVIFAIFLNHRPGDRGAGHAEMTGLLRQWEKP